jgi:hypothetical protein
MIIAEGRSLEDDRRTLATELDSTSPPAAAQETDPAPTRGMSVAPY